jgi:2-dehydropantoate 2-reductase
MNSEKPIRYVIFGAGAIGCVLGGLLARSGARVLCVARPAQAVALRTGLVIKQEDGEVRVRADAVTSAREIEPESGDVIIITTKSQATQEAVEELSEVYGSSARVVCLQNGVRNEEIASRRFDNVYAGLVFFSAVQLDAALVTLPRGRTIAIGRYPEGVDELSRRICEDLARAGFDAIASAHVMAMKWGKFILNLNNATHTITGQWVEQGSNDPDMRSLMYEVRDEGLRVLERAGIAAEPPAGETSPIKIRELTEKLKEPPRAPERAADLPEHLRTYASMWQDLYLGRRSNEADFLNGEVVRLGAEHGVATPYNSALLEIVNRMFEEGLKPGIHTPAELHALIRRRAATDSQDSPY